MNPLLIKLIVALAPCVEQVVAALLKKLFDKKGKDKDPAKTAKKIIEAAEAYAKVSTDPNATAHVDALAAWAKRQPTPEAYTKLKE